MKGLAVLALLMMFSSSTEVDPWFKSTPRGWEPQCPVKTTFIHQIEKNTDQLAEQGTLGHPDQKGIVIIHEYSCRWNKPMAYKPTQDEFKCIDSKKASKLPVCSDKESYK